MCTLKTLLRMNWTKIVFHKAIFTLRSSYVEVCASTTYDDHRVKIGFVKQDPGRVLQRQQGARCKLRGTVSAHGAMVRWIDSYRYSQCSTIGAAMVVACALLSVGWCI